jgi:hypothetical protein
MGKRRGGSFSIGATNIRNRFPLGSVIKVAKSAPANRRPLLRFQATALRISKATGSGRSRPLRVRLAVASNLPSDART